MNSSKFGRFMALLLCLVMIASQLGMTTFEAAETHDHDHEEVGVIDAAPTKPVEPEVPSVLPDPTASEPAAAPAPQAPVPEVTEPEVTEPEVTEPTAPEITTPETTESEIDESEATESEVTEPEAELEDAEPEVAAEPQIMTMELVSAPEGDLAGDAPMGDVVKHAPQITTKVKDCTTVEVTITDSGSDLNNVSYSYAKDLAGFAKEGTVDVGAAGNAGSFTFTLDKEKLKADGKDDLPFARTLTITATDEQGSSTTAECSVGHAYGNPLFQRVDVPPTCEKYGMRVQSWICGKCGVVYDRTTSTLSSKPPIGHKYDKDHLITGCGVSGNVSLCANGCGKYVNEKGEVVTVNDSGHQWEDVTVEATCDKEGYTAKRCKNCGVLKDYQRTGNPLGHVFGPYKEQSDVPCGQPVMMVSKCINSGCDAERSYEIGKKPHTYGNVIALTEENLKEAGVDVENEGIKAKIKGWAPTCTEAGATGRVCSKCHEVGEVRKNDDALSPALGHDYSKTQDCTKAAECSRCGETVPGKGSHNLAWEKDENGHYQYCTNEGCTYTTQKDGQPLPHTWSTSAYDCTKDRKCTACGYVAHMSTSNQHNWEWVQDESHTYHYQRCTNDGCQATQGKSPHGGRDDGNCTTEYKCPTCGLTVKEAMQHDFSGEYSKTSYNHYKTCKNPGCGVTSEKAEHTYTNPQDCTKSVKCTVCGQTIRDAASMHNTYNMPVQGDEQGHYQMCRNPGCEQKIYLKGEERQHSGGEANCVTKAVCEVCHLPYGEVDLTNHAGPVILENVKDPLHTEKGYSGDMICQACNTVTEQGHETEAKSDEHTWGTEQHYDDEGSWYECTGCGTPGPKTPHTFDGWQTDGTHHWQQCIYCAHTTTQTVHEAADDAYDNDCSTAVTCATCGYEMEAAKTHDFGGELAYGPEGHWYTCANEGCGVSSDVEKHNINVDDDCTTAEVCADCGYEKSPALDHNWSAETQHNAAGHWYVCENDGCKKIDSEAHTPSEDDHLCTTPIVCSVCGEIITPAAEDHVLSGGYQYDEDGHWRTCTTPGCTYAEPETLHSGDFATCSTLAVCEICGQSYGELDPNKHEGVQELRGYKDPTEEEEGYTGDYCWTCCDAVASYGESIPKLPPKHVHKWSVYDDVLVLSHDGTHHWKECIECGTREDIEEHDLTWHSDGTHHYQTCSKCGYMGEPQEHILEVATDGTGHWERCTLCHRIVTDIEGHTNNWVIGESGHFEKCSYCGYETALEAHDLQGQTDSVEHWSECAECGYLTEKVPHEWVVRSDETHHWYGCSGCGYTTEKLAHTPGTAWEHDGDSHWHVCTECGAETDKAAHKMQGRKCSVCDYVDPNFVPEVTGSALSAANKAEAEAAMEAAVEAAVKAGGDLANKILTAVDEGKAISVELVLTPTGTTATSKTVDIEILVKAGNETLGSISEVDSEIYFSVSLDGLTGRIIRVLREHNGVTEVLASSVSGNTVTFASSLFSTFTIQASNDLALASAAAIPDQAYTGKAIEPAVTVTINGGEKLVEGVDYTLSYKNNVEPGTATVIVTGIGDFEGYSLQLTFTITAPAPTATPASAPKSPKTGDETPLALYGAMLALGLSALAALLLRRRTDR